MNRLAEFRQHMEAAGHQELSDTLVLTTEPRFAAQQVTLFLPQGQELVRNLTLTVDPGENLLIQGPNGAGKSTLLRLFAGLWPFASGHLTTPAKEDMLFVPQKSYLPIGTLRSALIYPSADSDEGHASEQLLTELLRKVGLPSLTNRLNQEADWSQILSMGEQQKLAFARILYHRPQWLILDEATSAVDEQTEQLLYGLLASELPGTTLISVGHRQSLEKYHQHRLELDSQASSFI